MYRHQCEEAEGAFQPVRKSNVHMNSWTALCTAQCTLVNKDGDYISISAMASIFKLLSNGCDYYY